VCRDREKGSRKLGAFTLEPQCQDLTPGCTRFRTRYLGNIVPPSFIVRDKYKAYTSVKRRSLLRMGRRVSRGPSDPEWQGSPPKASSHRAGVSYLHLQGAGPCRILQLCLFHLYHVSARVSVTSICLKRHMAILGSLPPFSKLHGSKERGDAP